MYPTYAARETADPRAAEHLARLFERRPTWRGRKTYPSEFVDLSVMLTRGYLSIKAVTIPKPRKRPSRHEIMARARESSEHLLLKWAGREWMLNSGFADAAHEVCVYGPRCDVFSESGMWVIECGNTDASGALHIMRSGDDRPAVKRYTLIPYQAGSEALSRSQDRWPLIRAFDLTWTPEAMKYASDIQYEHACSAIAKLDAHRAARG